ncbi:MAG: hypothetical protein EOO16_09120 [Chitinophagaceae bacterium]|nr:MAG: hypothetical protein EOO16_09120 [Chitinophagaceae bacterium]
MRRYYTIAFLYPALITVVGQVLYFAYELLLRHDTDRPLSDAGIFGYAILLLLVHTAWVGALCLPLRLGARQSVRRQKSLLLLCWFAAPLAWFAALLYNLWRYDGSHSGIRDNALLLANCVPFIIGLIVSYGRFRRYGTTASV